MSEINEEGKARVKAEEARKEEERKAKIRTSGTVLIYRGGDSWTYSDDLEHRKLNMISKELDAAGMKVALDCESILMNDKEREEWHKAQAALEKRIGRPVGHGFFGMIYEIELSKLEQVIAAHDDAIEAKNQARMKKEAAIFAKAKETGEKQILKNWSEECNDHEEECNIDNIVVYAMPDGSRKEERHHTW